MHFVRAVGEAQRADMRHRRAPAPKSVVTPPPPCAWIASSMTLSAMRGAATLIMAISSCAALLPALSIMSAAFRQSSRVISMSMRASAMRCSQTECSAMLLAEGDAGQKPLGHLLQRDFGDADRAHAMVNAAGAEPALRDLEAAAFAEQEIARRHANVLEQHLGVAVRRVVVAEDRQHAHDLDARGRRAERGSATAARAARGSGRSCP